MRVGRVQARLLEIHDGVLTAVTGHDDVKSGATRGSERVLRDRHESRLKLRGRKSNGARGKKEGGGGGAPSPPRTPACSQTERRSRLPRLGIGSRPRRSRSCQPRPLSDARRRWDHAAPVECVGCGCRSGCGRMRGGGELTYRRPQRCHRSRPRSTRAWTRRATASGSRSPAGGGRCPRRGRGCSRCRRG